MFFRRKLLFDITSGRIVLVAFIVSLIVYVVMILAASSPSGIMGFILLEPGTTAKIFNFYAKNLRGSFFTGFLALGGFLMSAKTFIIVNMKKEVYDSGEYKQHWLDGLKINGSKSYSTLYFPLRRLSNILFYTISTSFMAAISQLTFGLFKTLPNVMVCFFMVVLASCFLMASLFLIKKNLSAMFDHLDKESKAKLEADKKVTK